MRVFAAAVTVTLTLAAAAPARVVHIGYDAPAALPEYAVATGADEEAVLADVRGYFQEESYAWALAAANALTERWPDSPARAESDYYRLRCLMQLSRFAELDEAFGEYFRRYKEGPWAAEAVDFLLDVYTDCEFVLEDYTRREIAFAWDNYLEEEHGYEFRYRTEGSARLDEKRWGILDQNDRIYKGLMSRERDAAARLRLADRRVLNYVKMSTFLDWEQYRDDEQKYYDERKKYNDRVASFEMGDDMRSMLAFLDGLLELFALPPPPGGPDRRRTSWEEYEAWLNVRRLEAARASWERIAAEYGDAPGGLMARAALAHYDVVYYDEPEKAVALFEEVAELAKTEAAAELVAEVERGLSAPALAITEVKADAAGTPAVAVRMACRGIPEIEVSLYEIDPAHYAAFYDAFANAGVDAGALPGVTREVETRTIRGSERGNFYRVDEVTAEWNGVPPGLYAVECRGAGERSRAVFLLTGAAVISAGDGSQLYLGAVDAATGEPVPIDRVDAWSVRYADERFRQIASIEPVRLAATARAEGLFVDLSPLPKTTSVYLVVSTIRGPVVHACGTRTGRCPRRRITGEIITDRPLYKPGDRVRYKLFFREIDFGTKTMAAVPALGFELKLYPERWGAGEPLWSAAGATDDYGTFAGEFEIPAGTKLGNPALRAKGTVDGRDYYASGWFYLAEFEKPEYALSLKTVRHHYLSGETVEIEVEAAYYFGEPMAGGVVTYDVKCVSPSDAYAEEKVDVLVEGGKARLDENGRGVISFKTPGAAKRDNSLTVDVTVGDETAHLVEGSVAVSTYASDRRVQLSKEAYEYVRGENPVLFIEVEDLDGESVGGEVRLEAYEEVRPFYGYPRRGELLAEAAVTVPPGDKLRYELELPDPPNEVVVVSRTVGTNGGEREQDIHFDFVDEHKESRDKKRDVKVEAAVERAAVGDDVEINIKSLVEASSCLAAVYADDGSLAVRRVPLAPGEGGYTGSFALKILPEYEPRVTVHVVVAAGGKSYYEDWCGDSVQVENPSATITVDVAAGGASYQPGDEVSVRLSCRGADGSPIPADVSVAAVDEALLALARDQSEDVPGEFRSELGRYARCRVNDSFGKRGELAKVVFSFPYYDWPYGAYGTDFLPVDIDKWGPSARLIERVFLKDAHNPAVEVYLDLGMQADLAAKGDYDEGMTVVGGRPELYERLRDRKFVLPYVDSGRRRREPGVADLGGAPFDLVESGLGGGYGAGGGGIELRRDFADTALWLPNLRTNDSGIASASFKLPDNVTTWRVMALALDRGQRFGWGSASVDVSKPVIARLKAPRYFVAGDVARLAAVGHNYLAEPQELTLALEEEGLTHVGGEATATRSVDAGGREALYHWVEASPVTEAVVVTSARCGAGGDAAEYKFPVYPRGSQVRQAYAGRLRGGVAHALTVAEGAVPSSFTGELILAPSLAATLSHGLGFYRDYPYDCVEQTLNRFRVNAELAAAAAELGLTESPLVEGLPQAIERGLRSLNNQRYRPTSQQERGWPWNAGGPISPYITAYVLDGLRCLDGNPFVTEAARQDYWNCQTAAVEFFESYLARWRDEPDLEPGAVSLYVVDVALRVGAVPPDDFRVRKVADHYFETRPAREPMSLALLASVLHQMGDDERLAVVMRNLDNGAQVGPDDTIYWGKAPAETWRWWDDAVETTAKVLEVKLAYQPDDPNVPKMVDWLVDQRRGATWKSTKDSAAATLALMKYIKAHPELAAPIVATYKFGSREGGVELDPAAFEEPTEAVTFAWEDVAVGDNDVEITRTAGEGPAFYAAAVEYYVDADEIPAVRGSVTLEREYYVVEREFRKGRVEEKKKPLDGPVKLGDDVEVVIKINSPYDFDYVVLEDPKPAGLIYLEDKSGYSWEAGAYVELWNRRRSALFERLPRGETAMRYRLRAEVPGTYAALPARVYGMYSPDIGSSTASAVVEVGE
jgi:uncharacterized protein YfaS (alpha-2-macroglobulin family)